MPAAPRGSVSTRARSQSRDHSFASEGIWDESRLNATQPSGSVVNAGTATLQSSDADSAAEAPMDFADAQLQAAGGGGGVAGGPPPACPLRQFYEVLLSAKVARVPILETVAINAAGEPEGLFWSDSRDITYVDGWPVVDVETQQQTRRLFTARREGALSTRKKLLVSYFNNASVSAAAAAAAATSTHHSSSDGGGGGDCSLLARRASVSGSGALIGADAADDAQPMSPLARLHQSRRASASLAASTTAGLPPVALHISVVDGDSHHADEDGAAHNATLLGSSSGPQRTAGQKQQQHRTSIVDRMRDRRQATQQHQHQQYQHHQQQEHPNTASSSPSAYHMRAPAKDDAVEYTVRAEPFDAAGLDEAITSGALPEGLLLRYRPPPSGHHNLVRIIFTPYLTKVERHDTIARCSDRRVPLAQRVSTSLAARDPQSGQPTACVAAVSPQLSAACDALCDAIYQSLLRQGVLVRLAVYYCMSLGGGGGASSDSEKLVFLWPGKLELRPASEADTRKAIERHNQSNLPVHAAAPSIAPYYGDGDNSRRPSSAARKRMGSERRAADLGASTAMDRGGWTATIGGGNSPSGEDAALTPPRGQRPASALRSRPSSATRSISRPLSPTGPRGPDEQSGATVKAGGRAEWTQRPSASSPAAPRPLPATPPPSPLLAGHEALSGTEASWDAAYTAALLSNGVHCYGQFMIDSAPADAEEAEAAEGGAATSPNSKKGGSASRQPSPAPSPSARARGGASAMRPPSAPTGLVTLDASGRPNVAFAPLRDEMYDFVEVSGRAAQLIAAATPAGLTRRQRVAARKALADAHKSQQTNGGDSNNANNNTANGAANEGQAEAEASPLDPLPPPYDEGFIRALCDPSAARAYFAPADRRRSDATAEGRDVGGVDDDEGVSGGSRDEGVSPSPSVGGDATINDYYDLAGMSPIRRTSQRGPKGKRKQHNHSNSNSIQRSPRAWRGSAAGSDRSVLRYRYNSDGSLVLTVTEAHGRVVSPFRADGGRFPTKDDADADAEEGAVFAADGQRRTAKGEGRPLINDDGEEANEEKEEEGRTAEEAAHYSEDEANVDAHGGGISEEKDELEIDTSLAITSKAYGAGPPLWQYESRHMSALRQRYGGGGNSSEKNSSKDGGSDKAAAAKAEKTAKAIARADRISAEERSRRLAAHAEVIRYGNASASPTMRRVRARSAASQRRRSSGGPSAHSLFESRYAPDSTIGNGANPHGIHRHPWHGAAHIDYNTKTPFTVNTSRCRPPSGTADLIEAQRFRPGLARRGVRPVADGSLAYFLNGCEDLQEAEAVFLYDNVSGGGKGRDEKPRGWGGAWGSGSEDNADSHDDAGGFSDDNSGGYGEDGVSSSQPRRRRRHPFGPPLSIDPKDMDSPKASQRVEIAGVYEPPRVPPPPVVESTNTFQSISEELLRAMRPDVARVMREDSVARRGGGGSGALGGGGGGSFVGGLHANASCLRRRPASAASVSRTARAGSKQGSMSNTVGAMTDSDLAPPSANTQNHRPSVLAPLRNAPPIHGFPSGAAAVLSGGHSTLTTPRRRASSQALVTHRSAAQQQHQQQSNHHHEQNRKVQQRPSSSHTLKYRLAMPSAGRTTALELLFGPYEHKLSEGHKADLAARKERADRAASERRRAEEELLDPLSALPTHRSGDVGAAGGSGQGKNAVYEAGGSAYKYADHYEEEEEEGGHLRRDDEGSDIFGGSDDELGEGYSDENNGDSPHAAYHGKEATGADASPSSLVGAAVISHDGASALSYSSPQRQHSPSHHADPPPPMRYSRQWALRYAASLQASIEDHAYQERCAMLDEAKARGGGGLGGSGGGGGGGGGGIGAAADYRLLLGTLRDVYALQLALRRARARRTASVNMAANSDGGGESVCIGAEEVVSDAEGEVDNASSSAASASTGLGEDSTEGMTVEELMASHAQRTRSRNGRRRSAAYADSHPPTTADASNNKTAAAGAVRVPSNSTAAAIAASGGRPLALSSQQLQPTASGSFHRGLSSSSSNSPTNGFGGGVHLSTAAAAAALSRLYVVLPPSAERRDMRALMRAVGFRRCAADEAFPVRTLHALAAAMEAETEAGKSPISASVGGAGAVSTAINSPLDGAMRAEGSTTAPSSRPPSAPPAPHRKGQQQQQQKVATTMTSVLRPSSASAAAVPYDLLPLSIDGSAVNVTRTSVGMRAFVRLVEDLYAFGNLGGQQAVQLPPYLRADAQHQMALLASGRSSPSPAASFAALSSHSSPSQQQQQQMMMSAADAARVERIGRIVSLCEVEDYCFVDAVLACSRGEAGDLGSAAMF